MTELNINFYIFTFITDLIDSVLGRYFDYFSPA